MNSKNFLMTYLLNYAMAHDIGYDVEPCGEEFTSKALPEERLIIINTDWANQNEIPFITAHEIGHIMNGDTGVRYYDSGTINSKSEYHANVFGIKLLLRFCQDHDINFTNSIKFCEHFGVPLKLEYIVSAQLNGRN